MTRDTLFIVRGERFDSQAALERRVKTELAGLPLNQIVVNPFLQSVVNNYHPGFIEAGMCSTGEFEYLDFGEQCRRGMDTATRFHGGRLMMTHVLPLGGWRDCTVYPWRKSSNPAQEIVAALREKAAFFLPRPTPGEKCIRPNCSVYGDYLEYNHISPTFKQMATECIALMTDEEVTTRFGYDKFTPGKDELVHCIPDDHPAVIRLRELHVGNQWGWLCPFHHRNIRPAYAEAVLESL